jgi:predicted DsbA family dithiol-disulfide isomerase
VTKIDILSDPICPWCLIGKTFLDRALKARPNHNFKLEWHPYMLNPTMQLSGMNRKDYLTTKFGSKENAEKVYLNIKKTALEHKIQINFDDIKRTPNTLNAHRLIHWAGLEQKQNSAVDLLFSEYFVNGNDISNQNILTNIANKIEMNKENITQSINSDEDLKNINDRIQNAGKKGVNGVPCFIIDNQYVLQGAQSTELWIQVIDEISNKNNA